MLGDNMNKENFDFAIQFEKFNLGYGVYIFKPIGILEGTYDKELETFQSKYGELYYSIKHSYNEETGYFYAALA